MISYWAAYLLVSILVTINVSSPKALDRVSLWLVVSAFILFVGMRYNVGGDWGTYKMHLAMLKGLSFSQAVTFGDPGYYFLNWLASVLGRDIAFVNTLCAIIVCVGLAKFAAKQPFPWLAYLVAIPYLIIVVSMGYTRQSAALGFAMIALAALSDNKQRSFVLWILLGALFHKSAVLLLPIAALSASRNKTWSAVWVGATGLMATNLLLIQSADDLWRNYVEADYQSQGALIRVAMNAVPSVIFLLYGKRLSTSLVEYKLWTWMSIISLSTIPLVIISSTAVDRVALYLIPIQLFVFSRLPYLSKNQGGFQITTGMVVS